VHSSEFLENSGIPGIVEFSAIHGKFQAVAEERIRCAQKMRRGSFAAHAVGRLQRHIGGVFDLAAMEGTTAASTCHRRLELVAILQHCEFIICISCRSAHSSK
jgi:hypothetical protein